MPLLSPCNPTILFLWRQGRSVCCFLQHTEDSSELCEQRGASPPAAPSSQRAPLPPPVSFRPAHAARRPFNRQFSNQRPNGRRNASSGRGCGGLPGDRPTAPRPRGPGREARCGAGCARSRRAGRCGAGRAGAHFLRGRHFVAQSPREERAGGSGARGRAAGRSTGRGARGGGDHHNNHSHHHQYRQQQQQRRRPPPASGAPLEPAARRGGVSPSM